VIKKSFGEPRWISKEEGNKLVPPVLDCSLLELQQPMFKLAMFSNSMATMEPLFLVNLLTKLWRALDANSALAKTFSEYVKLAQIAMIHVLGSIEDEHCFSSLSFLKDRLQNRLDANLGVVVGMKAQQVYTINNFPYKECFEQWVHLAKRYHYGITG